MELSEIKEHSASGKVRSPQVLTPGQLFRLSALWFALQFFWASQQLAIMPDLIEAFTTKDTQGMLYGLIKSAGALVVIATQLTVGFISDHAYSKLGRRRPFIIFGVLSGCVAITLFMLAPATGGYSLPTWYWNLR